jgi:excinuclease UvrABC ATPase subunit
MSRSTKTAKSAAKSPAKSAAKMNSAPTAKSAAPAKSAALAKKAAKALKPAKGAGPSPRQGIREAMGHGARQSAARGATRSPGVPVADSHDRIRVHGARENNLKDLSIEIPKRRLTVFTGVSGSGKSSLVFGTIAAESQRLINETYSTFVQGFMPTLARPDVDVLEGLTPAIVIDQERIGGDVRSTVGTATDANAMLRILFSRLGKPHVGPPSAFSFNVASVRAVGAITFERGEGKTVKQTFERTGGMCPRCEGRGSVTDFDL